MSKRTFSDRNILSLLQSVWPIHHVLSQILQSLSEKTFVSCCSKIFYGPDGIPVAQSTISKQWRHTAHITTISTFSFCLTSLISPFWRSLPVREGPQEESLGISGKKFFTCWMPFLHSKGREWNRTEQWFATTKIQLEVRRTYVSKADKVAVDIGNTNWANRVISFLLVMKLHTQVQNKHTHNGINASNHLWLISQQVLH